MIFLRLKRYINIIILATLTGCIVFPGIGHGVASWAAADGAAPQGGTGDRFAGPGSNLEALKVKYYLAPREDRIGVLEEIREPGTGESLQSIVDLLKYPDMEVRREAVYVLKQWEDDGYLAVFRGMEDPEISGQCESIFVEMGVSILPFLMEMLEDPDPESRGRSAYLMGIIGDGSAVGPLYSKLQDPDRNVRIHVIQALSSLGDDRSLEGILGLFETADVALADFVVKAVQKFGQKAAVSLRAALGSDSVRVRSRAALALGGLRLTENLPDLRKALSDPYPAVRRGVVKALDSYHDMSALEGLLSALMDPDLVVQDYATTSLARLHPDSYPYVRDRVSNSDPIVRKNAIITLRKMGDLKAVPDIIAALEDPDPNVRMFAVTALIQFKDPRAIHPVITMLKKDEEIGWLASFAFMEIGGDSVDELLLATGDDSFCLTRNLIILQMGDRALDTLHRRALS
jgi:HEAT repeat protein